MLWTTLAEISNLYDDAILAKNNQTIKTLLEKASKIIKEIDKEQPLEKQIFEGEDLNQPNCIHNILLQYGDYLFETRRR
jgi:hypothetical protein